MIVDADDIVQTAFLRVNNAFEKKLLINPHEKAVVVYVCQTIKHLVLDLIKKRNLEKHTVLFSDTMGESQKGDFWEAHNIEDTIPEYNSIFPKTSEKPGQKLEKNELRKLVRDKFKELSIEHQQVVFLYYIKNLEVGTCAELLHLPIGTVKSRLFRARANLGLKLCGYMEIPALQKPEARL